MVKRCIYCRWFKRKNGHSYCDKGQWERDEYGSKYYVDFFDTKLSIMGVKKYQFKGKYFESKWNLWKRFIDLFKRIPFEDEGGAMRYEDIEAKEKE